MERRGAVTRGGRAKGAWQGEDRSGQGERWKGGQRAQILAGKGGRGILSARSLRKEGNIRTKVEVPMWKCPCCESFTFYTRSACFTCGRKKDLRTDGRTEIWDYAFLPRDIQEDLQRGSGLQGCKGGEGKGAPRHDTGPLTRRANAGHPQSEVGEAGKRSEGGQACSYADKVKGKVGEAAPPTAMEVDVGARGHRGEAQEGIVEGRTGEGVPTTTGAHVQHGSASVAGAHAAPVLPVGRVDRSVACKATEAEGGLAGKKTTNGGEAATGTRPKAQPKPPCRSGGLSRSAHEEWPSRPAQYVPPQVSRKWAADRLEAVEKRVG